MTNTCNRADLHPAQLCRVETGKKQRLPTSTQLNAQAIEQYKTLFIQKKPASRQRMYITTHLSCLGRTQNRRRNSKRPHTEHTLPRKGSTQIQLSTQRLHRVTHQKRLQKHPAWYREKAELLIQVNRGGVESSQSYSLLIYSGQ